MRVAQSIRSGIVAAGVPKGSQSKARRAGALSAAILTAGLAAGGASLSDDGEMVVFSGNANPELAKVRVYQRR